MSDKFTTYKISLPSEYVEYGSIKLHYNDFMYIVVCSFGIIKPIPPWYVLLDLNNLPINMAKSEIMLVDNRTTFCPMALEVWDNSIKVVNCSTQINASTTIDVWFRGTACRIHKKIKYFPSCVIIGGGYDTRHIPERIRNMSIKQKYLKDENGNIFSPIISSESVIVGGGLT